MSLCNQTHVLAGSIESKVSYGECKTSWVILISFSKFENLDYLMKKSGGYLDLRKSKRGFDFD